MMALIERFHAMNDTVKIERPMACRRHEDLGGRVKRDSRGNTVRVKTRVHDHDDDLAPSSPELAESPTAADRTA
jgi:hypothetical protein